MSGAGRRLARLEERARYGLPRWADEDWPADDQLAEWGFEDTTWKGEDASVSARQA